MKSVSNPAKCTGNTEKHVVSNGSRTEKPATQRGRGVGDEPCGKAKLQGSYYEETCMLRQKERKERRREGERKKRERDTDTQTRQMIDGLCDP